MFNEGSFLLAGHKLANGKATATCYCGAVQLETAVSGPALIDTHICNCTDCRKVTATMFASNFTVLDSAITYLHGEDKLTKYTTRASIKSGHDMSSMFCSVCGTLMARKSSGWPDRSFLRIGTVDDFETHEKELRPQKVNFAENQVDWIEFKNLAKPR